MKTIKLTRGLETIVDDDVYERIKDITWSWSKVRKNIYVYNNKEHNRKRTTTYLHRLVMGAKPGEYVDHVNGNSMDNRRANLRLCDNSQNTAHTRLTRPNKTGFRGVSFDKKSGKWGASISRLGKVRTKSGFSDPAEAAKAYDKLAIEVYGVFAVTNKDLGRYISP